MRAELRALARGFVFGLVAMAAGCVGLVGYSVGWATR
jgi:hypothetical protein